MQDKIRIAIVDSGVLKKHPLLKDEKINGIQITGDGILEDIEDTYGHGTAVYQIISSAKLPVEIINIKLAGIENEVEEEVLLDALEYIEANMDIDVINLSLGLNVVEDINRLQTICKRFDEKGVVLVAAFDNTGSYSYPAVLPNVIGVTTGESCMKRNEFEYFDDTKVNIGAMGNVQKLAWVNPEFIMNGGNSFACAHVTVQCIKYRMQGFKTRTEMLQQFEKDAKRIFCVNQVRTQKHFKIKKAILFPFNKEMHSMIRFSHLLSFEIVDVYDTKYSGLIGSDTAHLLKDKSVSKKEIKCIDQIDWDSFDTVILGHIDNFGHNMQKANFRLEFLQEIQSHQKQIYSFDAISQEELTTIFQGKRDNIDWPEVIDEDVEANPQGKLYRIGKPVLGVFGTSSKQGKFTLQLTLREKLKNRGFKVGQIGTEPSALLYGCDEVYPMGYNASVSLHDLDAVRYLNNKVHSLCEKDYDIILVGSQSGTVPYDVGNIGQYNLSQYCFLQGTMPDAAILCINSYDDPEHVVRTISFLKAATETEVIALVVYPMELRNEQLGIYGGMKEIEEEHYQNIKKMYEQQLQLPVYQLGLKDDMEQITETVISYFTD